MTRSPAAKPADKGRDVFKPPAAKKGGDRRPAAPSAVLVGEHGRYLIKSGTLGGEFVARAFPKPPTNARGLIAEAKGATEEAAIVALHEVIDARESQRTRDRRRDPRTGSAVPGPEEYAEAIAQVALSRPQRAMLTALTKAEDDGLTETRMAEAAGYKSAASANRSFAGAGLLIADYLSAQPVPDGESSDPEGISCLGFRGDPRDADDRGSWILHPELREAVRSAL